MDDRMFRQRMSRLELPVEPRAEFVEDLHDELAARLGLIDQPVIERRVMPRGDPWRRQLVLVAATVALLLALLGTIVGFGAVLERLRPQSVLEVIRASGTVRIAVQPGGPQAAGQGGFNGFDIDVAETLAGRLGARAEVVVQPVNEIFSSGGQEYQIGLPSAPVDPEAEALYLATEPYYYWPIYAVTLEEQPVNSVADLDGQAVCAVAGSPGETWVSGVDRGSLLVRAEPPLALVVTRTNDEACLAEVRSGAARAFVTDAWLSADLLTRRGLELISARPVAVEPRSMIVPRTGVGAEELRAALNQMITAMRLDGTLADQSRRWFGGQDVTYREP